MNNKVHVKTGDTVVIISGKDKGKQGTVMAVSPKEGKVIVEKCNMVTKHVKPRRMGEAGGIQKAEGAMYASKVQLVCPRCKSRLELLTRLTLTALRIVFALSVKKKFKGGFHSG